MNPVHPRSLTRALSQLTLIVLIGILAYALGFRRGSHSKQATPPETLEHPLAKTEPNSQSPALPSPLESDDDASGDRRIGDAAEASTDWRARGYEAGLAGLEEAFQQANSLKGRDQAFFIAGLFSNIAEYSSPRDALTIASAQDGAIRDLALKALVSEWTSDSESLKPNERESRSRRILGLSGTRQGLEVELASILGRAKPDPAVSQAWMEAFADHPGRSEIAARLAPGQTDYDPDASLMIPADWTDWEKDRFSKSLLTNWAQQNPKDAWNWYSENQERFPRELSSELLKSWAQQNPKEIIATLDTIKDAEDRLQAVEAISSSLALLGTAGALDWVEGLSDSGERDAGLQAIYEATPKGIGALLSMENGFPKISELVPGGALESTDIRAGDLIVESRETGGEPNDLYGRPLIETVGFLRGDPGSSVEIRVLRKNETTGKLEEHTVIVERDLLILDSHD